MRATRDEPPMISGADPAAIRGQDWGGFRSLILSLPAGTVLGPLLLGLPGNLCPRPQWGYVVKGQVRVTYADNDVVPIPHPLQRQAWVCPGLSLRMTTAGR